MWNNWKSYTGMQNGTHTLEQFGKKLNIHLPIWPSNPIPGETKTYSPPKKDLYRNIHSSFIYNSPQLETTPMPINWRRMHKLWYVYLTLLSNKGTTDTCNNLDESQKHYMKETRQKRVHSIQFHLHDVLEKAKL